MLFNKEDDYTNTRNLCIISGCLHSKWVNGSYY